MNLNNVHPNLVLVLVLAWSLLTDWQEAIIWAFLGGLLLDSLSGVSFGTFTLSLMITTTLATFWQTKYFANILLPILLALPYSLLFNLIILVSLELSGYTVAWGRIISRIVFPEGMMNVAVMALIFPVLLWMNKKRGSGELTI